MKVVLLMWAEKCVANDAIAIALEQTEPDIIGHINVGLVYIMSCDLISFEKRKHLHIPEMAEPYEEKQHNYE